METTYQCWFSQSPPAEENRIGQCRLKRHRRAGSVWVSAGANKSLNMVACVNPFALYGGCAGHFAFLSHVVRYVLVAN